MDSLQINPNDLEQAKQVFSSIGTLDYARRKKNADEIKKNIKRELFYSPKDKKNTKLHVACVSGDMHELQRLLNDPETDINAKTSKNVTPLMILCRKGNLKGVQMLMQKNCDLNLQSFQKQTALFIAVVSKNFECALELLKAESKIDIDVQDRFGNTTLMRMPTLYVIKEKVEDAVSLFKKLLSMGAKLDVSNEHNENIFHICTRSYHPVYFNAVLEVYKSLLFKDDIVNAINSLGHTPIVIAALTGIVEYVKKLLSVGAEPYMVISTQSEHGRVFNIISAYHAAAIKLSYSTLGVLLKHNGNKLIGLDMLGRNILQALIKTNPSCNLDIMMKFVKLILSYKECVDLKCVTVDGDTVLHYAAWYRNRYLYDYLLAQGASTSPKNIDGLLSTQIVSHQQKNLYY